MYLLCFFREGDYELSFFDTQPICFYYIKDFKALVISFGVKKRIVEKRDKKNCHQILSLI